MSSKWYQKTGWIIALLILFFPVGLYLMWRYATNWSKAIKWGITVFFAILTFISFLGDSKSTTGVEQSQSTSTNKATSTITSTQTTVNEKEEYSQEMLKIVAKLDSANQSITRVGKYGGELNFEMAQVYLDSAEKQYLEAKDMLNQVRVPKGAEKIDSLFNQALNKFLESVAIYQEGLKELDANKINEGVLVYKDAVSLLNQSAPLIEEFSK